MVTDAGCALALERRVGRNAAMLATCQPGSETLIAGELAGAGYHPGASGPGWVRFETAGGADPPDLAFAQLVLPAPRDIQADSVNALAQQAAAFFMESLRDERVAGGWPNCWSCSAESAGLARRVAATRRKFDDLLHRRLSRVARMAVPEMPRGAGAVRGLFVFFTGFDRALISRTAVIGGQRRMADDPAAPSRSYLKIEEAYGVLGAEPASGETVVDLGAAPGGWSYSAARRGARVIAVDNGPLKGGALGNARVEHLRQDAFGFRPQPGLGFDWLFCDLVEEPHHVLRDIVEPWLGRGWCRRFIINLKFGRTDPLALLQELRSTDSPFARHAAGSRIRHLYHDREEFTIVGNVKP
jgi:23S rRNA (cytidine2498-2'-O)-methyltransferase